MEFRLARKQDLTPKMCQAILSDAEGYCKENPQDEMTPWQILNIFINFCELRIQDPQFWLALKDKKLVGYIITQAVVDNDPGVYIRQGYITPEARGNGVMPFSLDVIAKKSKEVGAKFVSCKRYGDASVFGRMMARFGYKYESTEFRKEI